MRYAWLGQPPTGRAPPMRYLVLLLILAAIVAVLLYVLFSHRGRGV
jgi:hypothetical protein